MDEARSKDGGSSRAESDLFGESAEEWLRRWDAGDNVWSIEMGGLGPGYEQTIQVTAAEILRWLLTVKPHADRLVDDWPALHEEIRHEVLPTKAIRALGLSANQWAAAVSLAIYLYKNGPVAMMAAPQAKYRHIQVNRNFPRNFPGE
jgi:hypothetical protein